MTTYDFEVAAKNAILAVIDKEYEYLRDDYDAPYIYTIKDISVVWMTHVLGNKKGIFIDNGPNNIMYEVTYNETKKEMYVDAYEKTSNTVLDVTKINPIVDPNRKAYGIK